MVKPRVREKRGLSRAFSHVVEGSTVAVSHTFVETNYRDILLLPPLSPQIDCVISFHFGLESSTHLTSLLIMLARRLTEWRRAPPPPPQFRPKARNGTGRGGEGKRLSRHLLFAPEEECCPYLMPRPQSRYREDKKANGILFTFRQWSESVALSWFLKCWI